MKNSKQNAIQGATMAEYVLIIGLVAAAAVLGLTSVGTSIASFMSSLNVTISNTSTNL